MEMKPTILKKGESALRTLVQTLDEDGDDIHRR